MLSPDPPTPRPVTPARRSMRSALRAAVAIERMIGTALTPAPPAADATRELRPHPAELRRRG
jgi:hypothetical protein